MSLRNSILSSILGDVMGLPYRKSGSSILSNDLLPVWNRVTGIRDYLHIETLDRGTKGDNSNLALATLRSLKKGSLWYNNMKYYELPSFLNYEIGATRITKDSIKLLRKGKSQFKVSGYFYGVDNSTLIRVLPHAFFGNSLADKMSMTIHNCILTHGSPETLISSMLYVYTVYFLSNNVSASSRQFRESALKDINIWSSLKYLKSSKDGLEFLNSLPKGYLDYWNSVKTELINFLSRGKWWSLVSGKDESIFINCKATRKNKASGISCIKSSLLLFFKYRGTEEPINSMMSISRYKDIDTATIGALVGSFFGTYYDFGKITNDIQDYDYICKEVDDSFPLVASIEDAGVLDKSNIIGNEVGYSINCIPFGIVTLKDKESLVTDGNTKVIRYMCNTELGQTLYFKEYRRL